jgi:hypothetical protein
MSESPEVRCVENKGDLLIGTTRHKRGSLEMNGYNFSSDETSVGMYKLKEAMKKSCSDLLAIHQRKCTHGRMKILKSLDQR